MLAKGIAAAREIEIGRKDIDDREEKWIEREIVRGSKAARHREQAGKAARVRGQGIGC